MTLNTLISELQKRRAARQWKDVAAEIGCSQAYLCDVVRGRQRPGKKILDYLGVEQIIQYRKVKP
jgi:hypothetical protein